MHLDTVCTMVDTDAVVMYPNSPTRCRPSPCAQRGRWRQVDDRSRSSRRPPDAMGIEKLRVIATGLDPVTAEREQWDDGNNTLAVAPGVVVAYERNIETNARLGFGHRGAAIAASELGTGRGGPRCPAPPPATRSSALKIASTA